MKNCGERQYWLALPCPNCGQQDSNGAWKGARMHSTSWGHGYSCCSEKCGVEFAEKLKRSEKSQQITLLENQIGRLQVQIQCLKADLREGKL